MRGCSGRRLAGALFGVALCLPCEAGSSRFAFEHFTQEEGLGNSLVRCLLQDWQGFLWVGAHRGLYRFDGVSFRAYGRDQGLTDPKVQALAETTDRVLWVATQGGLFRRADDALRQAPAPGGIHGLAAPRGGEAVLYAATAVGLFRIRPGPAGWEEPAVERLDVRPAYSVRALRGGAIAYGCGSSICLRRGEKTEAWAVDRGVPGSEWRGIAEDTRGNLYVRGERTILVLRAGAPRFEPLPSPGKSPGPGILETTRDGSLLVPAPEGLLLYENAVWETVDASRGLPGASAAAAIEDREGSLWIGLDGLGLARWQGRREWVHFLAPEGMVSSAAGPVARDARGRLWVGSKNGLYGFKEPGPDARIFREADGLAADNVRDLAAAPDGSVWVASPESGLARIDAAGRAAKVPAASGLTARTILSLVVGPRGELWVCARDGLFRQADGTARFERVATPLWKPREQIYRVAYDPAGRLWLAGNRGLQYLEGSAWRRLGKEDGLRSRELVFLAAGRDGSIWVGYAGLMGISRGVWRDGRLQFEHYHTGNRLRANDISFLGADRRGWIWVGTDNGVDVTDGERWRHFARRDGLLWHDTVLNGFHADAGGAVWIGTNRGLARYTPVSDPFHIPAPPVVLTGARLGGKNVAAHEDVRVPYAERFAEFDFAGLSFAHQQEVRFRYRLLGLDEEWVETGQRRAAFQQLPGGRYRFEVQASANLGPWSPAAAAFGFEIIRPWWATPWFRLPLIAVAAALARLLWLWRMRSILEGRRELEEAVRARTAELESQKGEIERLLEKSREASRLKSEFLANVSHEIRTPLNGILGMSALALETARDSEQRECLETVRSSGEALLFLLNEILDYSRLEADRVELQPAPFSVRECLEQAAATLQAQARRKGLQFHCHIAPGVPAAVVGDAARLRQVLLNLLSNAIKFTEKGHIRVECRAGRQMAEGVELHFHVADTGPGVPEAKKGIIFEAFRQADGSITRKYGGTGLGLAICRRLVEIMGGRIWHEDNPVGGSVFRFTARFGAAGHEAPAAANAGRALAAPRPPSEPLSILVAEDNAVNRRLLEKVLTRHGHHVTLAQNGREAIERLEAGQFDVVLMDVQMPEMDGLMATRLLRQREAAAGRRTPVLVLTASAMEGDRERCLDAGADGYVAKPVSNRQLFEAIDGVAGRTEKNGQ